MTAVMMVLVERDFLCLEVLRIRKGGVYIFFSLSYFLFAFASLGCSNV